VFPKYFTNYWYQSQQSGQSKSHSTWHRSWVDPKRDPRGDYNKRRWKVRLNHTVQCATLKFKFGQETAVRNFKNIHLLNNKFFTFKVFLEKTYIRNIRLYSIQHRCFSLTNPHTWYRDPTRLGSYQPKLHWHCSVQIQLFITSF